MSANNLTVQKRFEVDSNREYAADFVEASKAALEEEAKLELDERMGKTLADFQLWPNWSVKEAKSDGGQLHTMTMKVVFKP